MSTVLITGGSGLIGTRLTELLLLKGYAVIHLSRRNKSMENGAKVFRWNVENQAVDHSALQQADYIIHLAGVSIGDKRWNEKRKKEIVDSRVEGANLLFNSLKQHSNKVKAIISPSAIGYYGNRGDELLNEELPPADDFLGNVCAKWESAIQQFSLLNIREVRLRTGIVLSEKGGALPRLITPVKFGIAPLFGNGKPWYSWIHLDDLCNIYIHAIEHEQMRGAYNAVAPNPVRFGELMNAIRKKVNRYSIPFPVPDFLLKIIIGELGESLAYSINVSSEKILKEGFRFQYEGLGEAMKRLY